MTGAFLLIFGSLPSIVAASLVCLTSGETESQSPPTGSSNSGYRRDMFVAVLCSSALHHTNFSNLSSIMRTALVKSSKSHICDITYNHISHMKIERTLL